MGHWVVDGVKDGLCSTMDVSGPASETAWANAQNLASKSGVTLNMGSCSSQGFGNLVTTLPSRTFNQGGYTAEWDGKVWSK